MHVITALHENALAAMADGYAKASGKTPFITVARPGFPNTLGMMWGTWRSGIPLLVATAFNDRSILEQNGYQDADHLEQMVQPITKWHWVAETTEKVPEITRRALKFASTPPCGPVFLAIPSDVLRGQGKALIMDQAKFTVPMKLRPDPTQVEKAARLLLEAKNPLLFVGDEITRCGAQKEAVELAELLGLPVAWNAASVAWSIPFPTRHPLYVGFYFSKMRYPSDVDVMLNLGSKMPAYSAVIQLRPISPKLKVIEVRMDADDVARVSPVEVPMVVDTKLAIIDLIAAIRSMATEARLKQMRDSRMQKTQTHAAKLNNYRQSIVRGRWDEPSLRIERVALEMEEILEKDTCFVHEPPAASQVRNLMSFGGTDKQYFSRPAGTLGWGVSAAFGVTLARPNSPVVALVGDGGFLFGGLQPLWSFARYKAPVTIMVVNNRSYDSIRRGSFLMGGRMYQTGRDMGCYLGDPDIGYVKASVAFGVEAESVQTPSHFRPALERAKRANAEGRPYLLDLQVEQNGPGAGSTWHPEYSIAALRQRKVAVPANRCLGPVTDSAFSNRFSPCFRLRSIYDLFMPC